MPSKSYVKGTRTSNIGPGPTGRKPSSVNTLLILAVLAAALPRIALLVWTLKHGVSIENEGAEYTRIAQNLISGRGYVGMFNNGVQLNHPPLFPLLIAALSFVLPSELAARLINVLFGTALVIPMFKLAGWMYDQTAAVMVAVLVAFHPLLIARSVMASSETPYLTLLMASLYFLLRWIEQRQVRTCILAGVFLGLAYLMRPEAFLMVVVIAFCGLVWGLFVQERRPIFMGILGLVAVFLLIASPYIAFLSIHSGKFRIEGKGSIAYAWGKKVSEGMSYNEAATRIGDDLSEEGVYMKSNYDALRTSSYTVGDLISLVLRTAPRNLKKVYFEVAQSGPMGVPMLFLLAFLGLLRSPWDRRRAVNEGILLSTALLILLTLLTLQWLWPRYFHSLLGFLLLWASKGTEELYHWGHDTATAFFASGRIPGLVGLAVQWVAVLSVILVSLSTVAKDSEFRDVELTERKAAGQWLSEHWSGPKWIMDSSLIPAYYAKGNLMYLPYASSDVALRYISNKKPDFIVLTEYSRKSLAPYVAQWFEEGIPDQRAKLVYDKAEPSHERVKIYAWNTPSLPATRIRE